MNDYLAMLVAKARGSASRIRPRPDVVFERVREGELLTDNSGLSGDPNAVHGETEDRVLLSQAVSTEVDGKPVGRVERPQNAVGRRRRDDDEATPHDSGDQQEPLRLPEVSTRAEHEVTSSRIAESRPSRAASRPVEYPSVDRGINPQHDKRGGETESHQVDVRPLEVDPTPVPITPATAVVRHTRAAVETFAAARSTASGQRQDVIRPGQHGLDLPERLNESPNAGRADDRPHIVSASRDEEIGIPTPVRARRFTGNPPGRNDAVIDATVAGGEFELSPPSLAAAARKPALDVISHNTGSGSSQDDTSAVHISIGRIEIREQRPSLSPAPARPVTPPRLDLKDYLTRRMRGDSHG